MLNASNATVRLVQHGIACSGMGVLIALAPIHLNHDV